MNDLTYDLRVAVRELGRRPGFVVGAVLSLAIGMALVVALFSVTDSALLRPLPYRDADRLVHLYETTPEYDMTRVPPRFLLALRDQSSTLDQVASYSPTRALLGRNGEARSVAAVRVTTNFFDVFGVSALRGRTFERSNGATGDRAVVIAYSLWASDFGSDPNIVGRPIVIGGVTYTIAGVMPATFAYPSRTQLWLPMADDAITAGAAFHDEEWSPYYVLGRLSPRSTVQQASVEARLLYGRLYSNQAAYRQRSARVVALSEYVTQNLRAQLRLWGAAAMLILLLCAVNFATVSLARGMQRSHDIAVRAALGASRVRIARLLLVESTVIAVVGGACAVLLASWLLGWVGSLLGDGVLDVTPVMRWPTMVLGVTATAAVGFGFALAPALELANVDLRTVMQRGTASTTARKGDLRGRQALVALQLCLAITGVAVVTALVKADRRFRAGDIGFDESHLIIAYANPLDSAARRVSLEPMLADIGRSPAVTSIAATGSMDAVVLWTDRDAREPERAVMSNVSPSFFTTLGVAPVAGRLPTAEEQAADAPVTVMSLLTATQTFGSAARAAGQRVRVKLPGKPATLLTVVGVVPDVGGTALNGFSSSLYSLRPLRNERAGMIVARVAGDPQYRMRDITRAFAAALATSRLSVSDVKTARSLVERARSETQGRDVFLTVVAALALGLAIVGVYGLTSYSTEMRARDFGIRIALGAGRGTLARLVVGDLWWMAVLGVACGVAASTRLVAFLDSILRNPMMKGPLVTLPIGPTAASALALGAIMVAGTALPLRRVMRMDVMRAVQSGG